MEFSQKKPQGWQTWFSAKSVGQILGASPGMRDSDVAKPLGAVLGWQTSCVLTCDGRMQCMSKSSTEKAMNFLTLE